MPRKSNAGRTPKRDEVYLALERLLASRPMLRKTPVAVVSQRCLEHVRATLPHIKDRATRQRWVQGWLLRLRPTLSREDKVWLKEHDPEALDHLDDLGGFYHARAYKAQGTAQQLRPKTAAPLVSEVWRRAYRHMHQFRQERAQARLTAALEAHTAELRRLRPVE